MGRLSGPQPKESNAMRSMKGKKGNPFPRALADEKLKAAWGGTNSPTQPPTDPGNDPTPDARAVIIDTGYI